MVSPRGIRSNEQTADNYYMKPINGLSEMEIQEEGLNEFNEFVAILRSVGVKVIVFSAKDKLDTPDAHFPNNWISFHEDGTVGVYPMYARNRRVERREAVLELLEAQGFVIKNVIDYSGAEEDNLFLEGTGSLVLDRINRKAYCALSQRSSEDLLIEFCEDLEYTPIIFSALQTVNGKREPIYHTNVMMSVGKEFAIVCLDCIDDKKELKNVIKHLKEDGKEIIKISESQVEHFAGNMLEVLGADGNSILVMSQDAFDSLSITQINAIEKYSSLVYGPLTTIEMCGGGSARCMMVEVFLPKA